MKDCRHLMAVAVNLFALTAAAQNTVATTLSVGNGSPFAVSSIGETSIATPYGGPLLNLHQTGPTYASTTSSPALLFSTDDPNGPANYFMSGTVPGLTTFFLRADGTAYYAGNVGIGTTAPLTALTLAGTNATNPNTGAQVDYNGENLSFENLAVGKALGDIRMVQPTGYYVDAGDMVFSTSYGTLIEKMRITALGNLGIGTTTPGAKLEVSGNVKLTAGSGASMTYQDGSVQTVAWNGVLGGGDYAESVDVAGDRAQYEPGDVLVIDAATPGRFLKSATPYSTAVAGIYSTKPGVRGRRQETDSSHMKDEVPMAMVGVVPTKVSAEGGPIKSGDLLVTSSRAGYAMKGTDRTQLPGAIIGKAMSNLASGAGVIEVLVSLQ